MSHGDRLSERQPPRTKAGAGCPYIGDLERSRHFYRDTLGLALLFEVGNMMFFDLGGTRLLIGTENSAGGVGGAILYLDAPDIDTLAPALEAKGVIFIGPAQVVQRSETHELKIRAFRDPDGKSFS